MARRRGKAESAGKILDGLLPGFSIAHSRRVAAAGALWASVAGPDLAAQSAPMAVRDELLEVAVTSEPWRRRVETEARGLLGALRVAPELRALRRVEVVVVSPERLSALFVFRGRGSGARPRLIEPGPLTAEQEEALGALSGPEHAELKRLFESWMRARSGRAGRDPAEGSGD